MKKEIQPREETAYMAVRKAIDGHLPYLDIGTASGALDVTRRRAEMDNKELAAWAKDNPVVGYALCHVIIDQILSKNG